MTVGFLEVAHRIGRRLVEEAIWYEGRCNWMGASPEQGSRGETAVTHRALAADLYGGTAGVALFLAELYAATGDESVRSVAGGAVRHALSRLADADACAAVTSLGLHGGRAGVALAVARAGCLTGEWGLVERAGEVLSPALAATESQEFDLVSGRAGTIVGLLVMRELLHDHRLLDQAIGLGDQLVAATEVDDGGCAWASPGHRRSRPLTGFSHGAAGAGYALVELFRCTGVGAYRSVAETAFEYERRLFDAAAQNWPDLREHGARHRTGVAPSFATFWCHGAPGIALSRLRAHELSGDETTRREAVTAAETTRRMVVAALPVRGWNYSLCHGLAGNAEVLLHVDSMLGRDMPQARALALRVAEVGIEQHASASGTWPCGVRGGETPGLLVGLAGIGLFYLRLHDPSIPSLLLVRPESFGG